ncbi:hypothetical protein ACI79D_22250 [Geodermatophilus sp. SYSU D00708]
MTGSDDRPTVHVEADGRVLAAAEIEPPDDSGVAHSALHVESGQLPPGTRSSLVDAVLEHPEVDRAQRLVATMPIGDTEMLDRVRERTQGVETRAAGATKIVEARLDPAD